MVLYIASSREHKGLNEDNRARRGIEMSKKIRFALKLRDDMEVRTLSELREYFDIDRIMEYFLDGRLKTWLEDRYYEAEVDRVQKLDKDDPDLSRKLCETFGAEYLRDALTPEEIEVRNKKIERLKEISDDEEILAKVDSVAFSQEELADLLDEGLDTIYLCGKDFHIPLSKRDMTYIGVQSKIEFTKDELAQYEAQNIRLVELIEMKDENAHDVDEMQHHMIQYFHTKDRKS